MPVDPPYAVYRSQLSSRFHGLALWNPSPQKQIYDKVSIGDVGFLHEGTFIRMFNATLPWDHPSNGLLGKPEYYDFLDSGPSTNTIESQFEDVVRISRSVTANADNVQAMTPDESEGITYTFRNRGALLSLPNGGTRLDVIRKKGFEDYIRDHVDRWFNWAQNNRLGVERMEDLILVSGCTMVTSWAAAACVDNTFEAEITLTSTSLSNVEASFVWNNIRGHVACHNSHFDPQNPPTMADQCVFIRGFRAKRVLLGIKVTELGSSRADENPPRRPLQQKIEELRNSPHSLGDNTSFGGSGSSLNTIVPISHGNPQLLPYPSSITLQSNGSVYNSSFMTSPSYDSSFNSEVGDYIAEMRHENAFVKKTTRDNGPPPLDFFIGDSHLPFNIYQKQLSSQYFGIALWNPNPVEGLFNDRGHVSIGDVGYLDRGTFVRIFNVVHPWDHPSNTFIEIPEGYEPLELGPFVNFRENEVGQKEFHVNLSKVDNIGAKTLDEAMGQMYGCRAGSQGALLSLPHGARTEDVIRTKVFGNYIRDNVDSWLHWSKKEGLPVQSTEDLILVTGCTLATSWAAAVFDGTMSTSRGDDAAAISLRVRKSDNGGAEFVWRNVRGSVEYHNTHFDPNVREPSRNQCVFIRGFRGKRTFFGPLRLRAAAEPRPDDPDNCREDEIQMTRIPDNPNSRDPLVGALDYAIQKYSEDIPVTEDIITHDDDLQLIEGVNGVTVLSRPAETEPPVSEKQASELNGEPAPLIIHPASTKYNLKIDFSDHGYDLPKEIFTSAYPPMPVLSQLEGYLGHPQIITVGASVHTRGLGGTVLWMIHEVMRIPFLGHESRKLGFEERVWINATFGENCNSEEELSKGPHRIDHWAAYEDIRPLNYLC